MSGATLTVSDSPGFAPNQFVRAAGSQPKTYYVQIGAHETTNPNEGRLYRVTANDAGSLTVDLQGDDLSAIAAGTRISVIPYWTLGTLFPAAQANITFTPSGSGFLPQTQILIPDSVSTGVNLAPNVVYHYLANGTVTGWRKVGDPVTTDHADDLLPPGGYFLVRHANGAPPTSLVLAGSVATAKTSVPLWTNASSAQDNFLSLPQPVDATLDTLGLSPANGNFTASANGFLLKDQLLVFDQGAPIMNRAPTHVYFYVSNGANVGWRQAGGRITADHGADVIPAGSAFILRKASSASAVTPFWTSARSTQ